MTWIPRATVWLRASHIAALFALLVVVSSHVGNADAGSLVLPNRDARSNDCAWNGTPPHIPITVPDPDGHERWALQVHRSKTGKRCLWLGRLHRNGDGIVDFGQVYCDGRFHRLDLEDQGSAVDLSKEPQALVSEHFVLIGVVATYGIVRHEVKTATLHLATETRRLSIRGGAYLAVLREDDFSGAKVRFTYRDGTGKTIKLGPPPGAGRVVGEDDVASRADDLCLQQ